MKTIKVDKVKNYMGGALNVPVFDEMGEMVKEKILHAQTHQPILDSAGEPVTKPVTKEGTIVDLLDVVVMEFPRNKLKMKHITEMARLHGVLAECHEQNLTEFALEDAAYEWLISILKDDQIGVPIFGMNLIGVLNALGADV
jgi:hypothetical protein